nr:MAG TPA: hypothetical protein [Herelleviridae sp.]
MASGISSGSAVQAALVRWQARCAGIAPSQNDQPAFLVFGRVVSWGYLTVY